MHPFSPCIFKAYDIRGIYPDELHEEFSHILGRSFGVFVKELSKKERVTVVVGRDSRLSSPALAEALVSGLMKEGADVVDIGLVSSPMHLFGIMHLRGDAGVMITASHNPKEYNGFKFTLGNGESVGEDSGLLRIKTLCEELGRSPSAAREGGSRRDASVLCEYMNFLASGRAIDSRIKVVADSGNGAVGAILPALAEKIGSPCIPLFWEPDGNFPNRSPDPTHSGATKFAKDAVRAKGADLGVVFDADGDRAVFVDERGEEVNPNHITAMLAEYFLKKFPGGKIWHDAVASRIVPEVIRSKGGVPIAGRVGRVRAKTAMKENDCVFGGEHSAHYYFRDYFFSDSALLTLMHVLEVLSEKKQKLSALVGSYARYVQSGELNFKVRDKDALLRDAEHAYSNGVISRLDGISIEYDDWWFNIRPSNTEPLVRLNIEAASADILEREKEKLSSLFSRHT